MSSKRGSIGSRAVSGIAGAAAAFAARKVIIFLWKRITGKEPPEHPEDPQVALREALSWALILGVGMHTARLLAARMTSGRSHGELAEPADHPAVKADSQRD
jgi:hypothetical protein